MHTQRSRACKSCSAHASRPRPCPSLPAAPPLQLQKLKESVSGRALNGSMAHTSPSTSSYASSKLNKRWALGGGGGARARVAGTFAFSWVGLAGYAARRARAALGLCRLLPQSPARARGWAGGCVGMWGVVDAAGSGSRQAAC